MKAQNMFDKYLDVVAVDKLCEMLGGISKKLAYRLLGDQEIKSVRIGRESKIPKAYSDEIQRLSELGADDPIVHDCMVDEIDSGYEVLGCLKGQTVNVDELDYLDKRLDSFDVYEMAQYQAACAAFECKDIRALINMTFCYQETTVICDFSKLEEAWKQHFLTIHGGTAPAADLDAVDVRQGDGSSVLSLCPQLL